MSGEGPSRNRPLRVVAIGGGTGLSTLLKGLKHYVASLQRQPPRKHRDQRQDPNLSSMISRPGTGLQDFEDEIRKIAVLICYDQWFPQAARIVSLMGADMIFYPTAIGK